MGFHLFDDNEEMDFISGNNRDDLQIGQYNQNFKLNPNIQPELENVTEKYQYPADVALPFVLAGGTADSPVAGQLANSIAQNRVKKESEIWQELKDRYEYENLEDNKPTYYSLGASYNKNASRFSVSYGKQRGGLLCYGGICRYIPEFKGLSFSINTSF